MKRLGLV